MAAADMHPACLNPDQLLQDCSIQRTKGSGPGGQHRNKVETAIVITHLPTGISGQASERRSQNENRKLAISRLRSNLAVGHRHPVTIQPHYQPSQIWQLRLSARRIPIATSHPEFPAILAEALDVVKACDFQVASAASLLSCSTSQLLKLLKKEPAAWQWVNRQRLARDAKPYR